MFDSFWGECGCRCVGSGGRELCLHLFCLVEMSDDERGRGSTYIHTYTPAVFTSPIMSRHSTVLELRGVGKKRVTLNTFAMQEKAAALDTLVRCASVDTDSLHFVDDNLCAHRR